MPQDTTGLGHSSRTIRAFTFDDALSIFRINSVAPLVVAQSFVDLLTRGNDSRVINITSGYASLSQNDGSYPYYYAASKATLNMFSRSMTGVLRDQGIVVSMIHPGWVKTDTGGSNATTSVVESVTAMIRTIESLSILDPGKFLDRYGKQQCW